MIHEMPPCGATELRVVNRDALMQVVSHVHVTALKLLSL